MEGIIKLAKEVFGESKEKFELLKYETEQIHKELLKGKIFPDDFINEDSRTRYHFFYCFWQMLQFKIPACDAKVEIIDGIETVTIKTHHMIRICEQALANESLTEEQRQGVLEPYEKLKQAPQDSYCKMPN